MANVTGGSVTWVIDAQSSQFDSAVNSARNKAKQLGDDVERVGKTSFSSLASNAGNSFNSIANGIADITKKIAIVTIGAGGIGTAFLKSAGDLEVANRSFQVLIGNVETANSLFADIKKFADQTPFQFPELASSAKLLLGYGVTAEDTLDTLKRLGDAAAASGGNLERITLAYAQMVGRGKVTGDNLRQLTENSVTLRQELSKAANVPMKDLDKAIENSEIDVNELNAALRIATSEGGKFFGGTEKLATTFNGRISTLKDTFMEFGRNLLGVKVDPELGLVVAPGGLFDRLTQFLPKVIQGLQDMAPKVSNAFQYLVENGSTIMGIIAAITTAFVGFKILAIITPLIAAFSAALAGGAGVAGAALAVIGGPITLIGVAVVALGAALAFLQVKFNIFGKAVKFLEPVLTVIKDVFSDLWTSIKDLGSVLAKELAPVFKFVSKNIEVFKKVLIGIVAVAFTPLIIAVGLFIASIKLLGIVIGFIADHFQTIKKVVIGVLAVAFAPLIIAVGTVIMIVRHAGDVVEWFGKVFKSIGNVISKVVSAVFGFLTDMFTIFSTIFMAIWGVISPVLNFIKNLFIIVFGSILIIVLTVLIAIKETVISVFNTIWSIITTVVGAIWNFMSTVWNAIWKVILTVTGFIWDRIVNAFNFYKSIIVTVFTAVYDFIAMIWNKVYAVISGVVQSIINFFSPAFSWLLQRGKDIINGLISGIRSAAGGIWGAIKSAADTIGNFFSGAGHWLYDVGRAIIQGMVNGIKSMANAASNAAGDVANGVKSRVKGLLGINSPSRVFMEYGKNVGQGFANGIDSTMSTVQSTMRDMSVGVDSIGGEMNTSPTPGNQQTVTIGTVVLNTPEAAKTFFNDLNQDTINLGMGLTPVQGA